MSDFIQDHEKISLHCNTLSCGCDRPCNTVFTDRICGINAREKNLRIIKNICHERGTSVQSTLQSDGRSLQSEGNTLQSGGTTVQSEGSTLQNEGKNHSRCHDNPCVVELERISSSIIRLLRNAKLRTVEASIKGQANSWKK